MMNQYDSIRFGKITTAHTDGGRKQSRNAIEMHTEHNENKNTETKKKNENIKHTEE